jgi:hypothetical protein
VTHKTIMYFSGSMTHPHVVERLTMTNVYRLFTFAAPREVHDYLAYCDARGIRARIMIDSGAFTAWNIGKPVKLEDLLRYDLDILRRYPHHDFVFVALDVIPGTNRQTAVTAGDIKRAVETSYANFLTMLQALPGRTVLPVYHSGEDRSVRDRYLSHVDYMCLSMNQNLDEAQRLRWAREAMVPGVKFHGLAATGNAMLSRVDWYSVDSSGWLMVAAMGSILFPMKGKLKSLPCSDTSPARKQYGKHLDNMPEGDWIRARIREQGYDPDELRTNYDARICWNIDMWNSPPWVKEIIGPASLFD